MKKRLKAFPMKAKPSDAPHWKTKDTPSIMWPLSLAGKKQKGDKTWEYM